MGTIGRADGVAPGPPAHLLAWRPQPDLVPAGAISFGRGRGRHDPGHWPADHLVPAAAVLRMLAGRGPAS
jgi:hypothetical protein